MMMERARESARSARQEIWRRGDGAVVAFVTIRKGVVYVLSAMYQSRIS